MLPIIQPVYGPEEEAAAVAAMRSGWVTQGPRVAEFERNLAVLIGTPHAVATTSATTALHLALHVAAIGPGDDVVVPSLSFVASTNAVWMVGARPVFADVDAQVPNVTVETLEAVWTKATRAVVAVHQLGVPFDREGVAALCQQRGAVLVEDAACAIGSLHRGRPIAEGAALSVFSFHPRKVLTVGEGGAIATANGDWDARLRRLRHHGMSVSDAARHGTATREQYLEPAFNYRMTDIQAAIGVVQLGRLQAIVAQRRALAERYADLLADLTGATCLRVDARDSWNVQTFCVRLQGSDANDATVRDRVLADLNAQGIGARRGVMAAHQEPAWAHRHERALPQTEAWAAQSLALPLFHTMTEADQQTVVAAVQKAMKG